MTAPAQGTRTAVRHIVEYRRPGGTWLTWPIPADKDGARRTYETLTASPRRRTEYRLIRRTTVTTDEVLEISAAVTGAQPGSGVAR